MTGRSVGQPWIGVAGGRLSAVPPRTQVVVVFGGRSAEHDVSCISARHVLSALDPQRYEVVPVGITRDGRWVDARRLVGDLIGSGQGSGGDPGGPAAISPEAEVGAGSGVASPDQAPAEDEIGIGGLVDLGGSARTTVVFPLLHGPMGEDGTVQGLLEIAGLPYVGAGVLASSLCMDKSVAKEILAYHRLPQTRWRRLKAASATESLLDEVAADLGFPIFVKPANLGSSIGISRAEDRRALSAAAAVAGDHDDALVFEAAVAGREIEVAVLGNDTPEASVPGEIVTPGGFYDYDQKYLTEDATLLVPAPLPEPDVVAVRELAVRAFTALGVEGMARVDFFYEGPGAPGGPGSFLVNEVNTIPGFTAISMYPKLWESTGLPAGQLLDRLIALALERHRRRHRRRQTR